MKNISAVTCAEIVKQFPRLFVEVVGDASRTVDRVRAPEDADIKSLVFLSSAKLLNAGLDCPARVIVVGRKLRDQALANSKTDRTFLISNNAELALAVVTSHFFWRTPYTNKNVQSVHPTAVIAASSQIASSARIGPFVVIGEDAKIGDGVYIGASTVIEERCEIANDTVIHPHVVIGHSTIIGARCEIHSQTIIGKEGYGYSHDEKGNHYKIPHQGRVVLEDDVHIGGNCSIDRSTFKETRLKQGAKLDNGCHVAHNCTIGRNAIITAGFIMAGSSRIGDNFVCGGNTNITGHIEITDNVSLAGVSSVAKSVTKPGPYGGYPLQPLQSFLRTKAALMHLPQMRRQLKMIIKHLGLTEDTEAELES